MFLGGKNVKICDFGQKKPSDFGEDFFCFWRSPAFGRKICDFGQKKSSHFGENLCPHDFNFAPPISRSWRRPWVSQKSRKSQSCGIIPTFKTLKYWSLMALFSKFLINLITKAFVLNNGCNAIYCTGQYSICWPLDRTAKRRFQNRNSCKTRAYFLVVVSVMLSLVDVTKEAGILKIALYYLIIK